MSIALNAECFLCHLRRSLETANKLGTPEQATAFAKELFKLYLRAPEGVSSPWLGPATADLLRDIYGLGEDRFAKEKAASNRFVLERLDAIRARVRAAEDPVFAALQFAVLGNYIDFSALQGEVSFEKLDELLSDGEKIVLDRDVYRDLCQDLQSARTLLYLTDNAGEIGFDRVLAEEIYKKYPQLQITFCVRGFPAMNDATREDAQLVGIPFPVIDNGNRVAGTQLDLLCREAMEALENSDVILSKGQANVETLYGSGYNIYYAFLIKCSRFITEFQQPKLTPMLLKEQK